MKDKPFKATYLLTPSFGDQIIVWGDKNEMIYPIVSPAPE